ncbi:chalcone isomerase family protein [Flammeovirga sp. OC4]|uniref:chalcone isomerase family protein n=1 Tax=Flammeovirga sp. OC4 TaxID=1382345 RepID=UPI0005C54155|nr:chalcone isomerase family protein [Flammeovirga sp. OC4]
MKRAFIAFLLTVMSVVTVSAQTTEISDVVLQNSVEESGTKLQLNGAGVRSKYFLSLYVGSLYLPGKSSDANKILYSNEMKMIQLDIISSLITAGKMEETVRTGFKNSLGGDTSSLQSEIDSFIAVFGEEIEVGDIFKFVTSGKELKAYKNGKLLTTVKGEEFQRALFGIWLGNKPADKKLKNLMLGV